MVKITLVRGLDRVSEVKLTAERKPFLCRLLCELLADLPQLTAQVSVVLLFFVFCGHKFKSLLELAEAAQLSLLLLQLEFGRRCRPKVTALKDASLLLCLVETLLPLLSPLLTCVARAGRSLLLLMG